MVVCVLVFPSFVGIEKSVNANDGTQFKKEDAGKFVAMGGRTWIVLDVMDGKPYLMMDEVYANRQWNSSGDSSNASEIFGFLESEFNKIITVAEDRNLIAETEWQIRSMEFFDLYNEHDNTGGKTINPSSITQELGLISNKEKELYCDNINKILIEEEIWTRTPDYDDSSKVYSLEKSGSGCFSSTTSVTSSIGVQPVLYLKDSVRIRGGEGTKNNPFVLSVSVAPNIADIIADATTNKVIVYNVPAGTTVKVYAIDKITQIGVETNGNSEGTVTVSVSSNLSWNDKVYVSFTELSKGESNKVGVTAQDKDPPTIDLSASPTTTTNQNVTVTANITDSGSDIAEKKWALGKRNVDFFHNAGSSLNANSFAVTENGNYTVYAKDAAGNESVKSISINNIDRTPPTLGNVSIKSSNTNTNWAKVGDQIELTFQASEELDVESIEVKIAEKVATVNNTGGLAYRAEYIMVDTDSEGSVVFSINYQDPAGNKGDPVASTTDNSQVEFDKTAPTIVFSPNGNTIHAKSANSQVTVSDDGSGVDVNTLTYVWTNSETKPGEGWQSFGDGTELTLNDLNANGNWYLHVIAQDQAGNESYVRSNAFLIDNEGPEIIFSEDGNSTPSQTAVSTVAVTDAGSGIDEGTLEYVWADTTSEPTDGWQPLNKEDLILKNPGVDGNWYIHVRAKDKLGNESYKISKAFLLDNTGPVITFETNGHDNPQKTAQSKVTVTDNLSDIDTLEYVWSDEKSELTEGWKAFSNGSELELVDPNANGNWYLHIRAKDKSGNVSYKISEPFVLDNTPPVITLNGNNPMSVYRGRPFDDPGATAIDNIDGDITEHMIVTDDIDTQTIGKYTVTYTVTDRAGNTSTMTRTVNVQSQPSSSGPPVYVEPP